MNSKQFFNYYISKLDFTAIDWENNIQLYNNFYNVNLNEIFEDISSVKPETVMLGTNSYKLKLENY